MVRFLLVHGKYSVIAAGEMIMEAQIWEHCIIVLYVPEAEKPDTYSRIPREYIYTRRKEEEEEE